MKIAQEGKIITGKIMVKERLAFNQRISAVPFSAFSAYSAVFASFPLKSVFIRVHLWFLSSTFVQKNIKKSIDSHLPLCHSDGTHGNINTQIK